MMSPVAWIECVGASPCACGVAAESAIDPCPGAATCPAIEVGRAAGEIHVHAGSQGTAAHIAAVGRLAFYEPPPAGVVPAFFKGGPWGSRRVSHDAPLLPHRARASVTPDTSEGFHCFHDSTGREV